MRMLGLAQVGQRFSESGVVKWQQLVLQFSFYKTTAWTVVKRHQVSSPTPLLDSLISVA